MKWLTVLCCVLPMAMAFKDGASFSACSLTASSGTATGFVACVLSTPYVNRTLFCGFQYSGFSSDVTSAQLQRADGTLVVDFSVAGIVPGTGSFDGIVREITPYQPAIVVKNSPTIPQVYGEVSPADAFNHKLNISFTDAVAPCLNGANCKVFLRTATETLSCSLGGMVFGAEFDFELVANETLPSSTTSGYVWLNWFVTSEDILNARSVWVYTIDYHDLSGPLGAAGFYSANASYPARSKSPPYILFDVAGAAGADTISGSFSGVAIQGQIGDGSIGSSSGYNLTAAANLAFLTECTHSYCYIGVSTQTATDDFLELRGQLYAGAAQLLPSLLWMAVLAFALAF